MAASVVVLFAASPGTASALSCAPPPDGSARSIVTGSEVLWGNHSFFDLYDYAITGTVTGITTDEERGSTTYGATEVQFDVINGFGMDEVPETVLVHQSDPGWLTGFGFELGSTYFVPLVHRGPNGERDYSFVCDPISSISPAGAVDLAGMAAASIPVASPTSGTTEPVEQPVISRPDVAELSALPRSPSLLPPLLDESATDEGAAPVLTLVAAAVGLAVVAIVVDIYRRRRATGDDETVPRSAGEPT